MEKGWRACSSCGLIEEWEAIRGGKLEKGKDVEWGSEMRRIPLAMGLASCREGGYGL